MDTDFLIAPEAGNPRSRCWQGWFLEKALFWIADGCLLAVSSRGPSVSNAQKWGKAGKGRQRSLQVTITAFLGLLPAKCCAPLHTYTHSHIISLKPYNILPRY